MDTTRARNRRAIFFVLGASACFSVASVLVKAVGPEIPVVEIMLFRSVFALVLLLPMMLRAGGWTVLRTRNPGGHFWRVVGGIAGMFGSYYGYAHLPLALVTALGFAMPIFLAMLSVPLLGERVSGARAVSIGAGLLGVLIVLRPWQTEGAIELKAATVVIVGVVAWAASMVSIRRMGQAGEKNIAIVMWYAIGTTVFAAVTSLPVWVAPPWLALGALVAVGLISALAQLLMTEGYRNGEATVLAPFEYGAILYTVLFGFLFWGEVPGVWETTGILVLVVSGLFTWWWETSRAPGRSRPASIPPATAAPSPPTSAAPPPSRPGPARTPG